MNLHFSFKAESAKTPDVERDIQQHVKKLDRYLTAYRPDLVHLHGTIDQKTREGFTVSLNLRLPTGQLAAQESGQVLQGPLKVAFSELISQLKRHKELIRNEHRWRRGRKPPRGAVTELQETVEQYVARSKNNPGPQSAQQSERPASSIGMQITPEAFQDGSLARADVRQFINGNLGKLQRFIEREIAFREENGTVESGRLTPEETIDEVVVNVLSAEDVPDGISTERWIYRVALDTIQRLSADGDAPSVRLEEPLGEQNVRASDDELLQYHQPGESHNREDFLANPEATTPEDLAAQDEMVDQIESALRGGKQEERLAFVLFTIEGFTVDEVSRVMERSADEVKQLIRSAREQVIKKLPPSNALKKRLIERSSVA
jgi:DNA-directed RNA polymerase specialized sigma24 family protein/ribosome-associated translation inhibitor RaiA